MVNHQEKHEIVDHDKNIVHKSTAFGSLGADRMNKPSQATSASKYVSESRHSRWTTHTSIEITNPHIRAVMRTIRILGALTLSVLASLVMAYRLVLGTSHQPVILTGYPPAESIRNYVLSNTPNNTVHPPLQTRGRHVIDTNDRRIKLSSINWYGASDELFVVGGLDIRHRKDIAKTIRTLGFNSVRLPYSDQLVRDNPIIPMSLLEANKDLFGMTALEVFEAVVNALTDAGIAVIINNHITSARWCCDSNLCDGTWYNSYLGPFCRVRQTQEDWIVHLETVMKPHQENPLVIGVDLRNEVRGVKDRFLWNDWAVAAKEAGERLHLIQPDWLIIVEGVSSANVLTGAKTRPVLLTHPNKLVYSAHVYGWSGWGGFDPYWNRKYSSFVHDMEQNWAFLLRENIAPVWIGEFGSPDVPNTGDLRYWKHLMQYLETVDADWGYWALNPRKPFKNEVEGYGLLEDDWETVRWDYRLYDMRRLMDSEESRDSSFKVQP